MGNCIYSGSGFAFKNDLNFDLLVDYWLERLESDKELYDAEKLSKRLKTIRGEEFDPVDHADLKKYKKLIDFMIGGVVAKAMDDHEIVIAVPPFEFSSFYASQAFKDLFGKNYDKNFTDSMGFTQDEANGQKSMYAYSMVLDRFYDAKLNIDKPFTVNVAKPGELERTFNVEIDNTFFKIEPVGDIPELSVNEVKKLKGQLHDVDAVMQVLPPTKFLFKGFMLFRLTDVTVQEAISSIKNNLLEEENIITPASMQRIEKDMQILFNDANMKIGISAYDEASDSLLSYGFNALESIHTALGIEKEELDCEGSIYENLETATEPIIISDLAERSSESLLDKALLDNGIRSVVLAPLRVENKPIGVVQLNSEQPDNFGISVYPKLLQVVPLFAVTLKNILEKINSQVQAVIKEECTVIHPSVEWRFQQAARNKINKQRALGENVPMEEIVFENVYPIFGASDIRGSSTIRNKSIQADLIKHLELVKSTTQHIHKSYKLPILDELIHRVKEHIKRIKKSLSTGDETEITDFLIGEVDPLFDHFKSLSEDNRKWIDKYYAELDPNLKVVYDKRKDFETSVSMLNQQIGYYLDEAEVQSQKMFPHYFEKYKSDGVEYNGYIGQSMVNNREFNNIYLKNLRLWQLLVTAEVERRTSERKSELPVPLDLTHLILVHNTPLSIRFRHDERKFDVDGAYNIRYEIVKKRIDKAHVKETGERLTQPGTIAIVYAQEKEAKEYESYIRFLQANGVFEPTLERFELEELPGATGLHALRVKVKPTMNQKFVDETLQKIISEIGSN